MMKWEVEKETKKYIYFRGIEGNRKRYERITKRWWLPLERFGERLERLVCRLHDLIGKRKKLTEYDRKEAKRLANDRVSEEEYLQRFSQINPYAKKGWAKILWFIDRHFIH